MPHCDWNEGCTGAAVEDQKHGLCEEHRAEQIRLHKIKVQGWAEKKEARDLLNLQELSFLMAADKGALFTVAQEMEQDDIPGEIAVTAVVPRGRFTNFLLGLNKGYIAQAGWSLGISGAAESNLAEDLSLAAARLYADEFNTRLEGTDLESVKAVPRV
jgi:hypothetical protein